MLLIQNTLVQIQLRLQVSLGRHLTYRELAELAGTSERTMSEWMRGATAPMAMNGLMNLISKLDANDATDVLTQWRDDVLQNPSDARKALDRHK